MEENTVTAAGDTEMEDCDGQNVVTMMDVLKEQEDFENNANAVLGASDEKNCTYPKGYIKRQAIYACMTCCVGAKDDPSKRAGVCLACSLTCHENHELIELYTKRNFRCDCGNPKFNSNPCQYTLTKSDLNENNEYNQNYSGLYCVCHRPYPDPESTVEDEMIQCIICEDWLHASHLEATVPSNDHYSEMICKGCMEKNSFLHDYSSLAVNVENDVDIVVDSSEVTNFNGNHINNELDNSAPHKKEILDKCAEMENVSNISNSNESKLTSESKCSEGSSVTNSNMEKLEEQSSDTMNDIKEKAQLEDECMEEDRLLADPEEENKLKNDYVNENCPEQQDKKTDTSEPVEKKEQDQPSIGIQGNELKECESNGDVIKNAYSEEKKDNLEDNTSTELSSSNENGETVNKVVSESEIDHAVEKTIDPKVMINNEINVEFKKNTEDDKGIIASSSLDVANEKTNKDLNTENTKDSNLNSDISKENEIENNTDLENENSKEETNKSEESKTEYKRKHSVEDYTVDSTIAGKRVKLDSCCIRPKNVKKIYRGATFWSSDFRQKLCTCNECITMYKDLSVLFLTEFDDTVTAYESLGEEKERIEGKPASQYEKGLQALSSLDRVQQINALTEYNKMKDKLLDFLKTFKDRKEVVKEEDIKEFFAGMKPKREPDGVYFCK